MSLTRGGIVGLALLVIAVVGCAKNETAKAPAAGQQDAAPEAPAVDVELKPVTFEVWQEELSSMKGSIVVVDLWATWCIPCIERFPKMVEMSERYSERGVRFVSLSLDDRDDENTIPQVTTFLERNRADGMTNYLMDEVIPDAFEKLDLLGIPAVYVYDANGELAHRLTGDDPNNQFTEADVEAVVEEMAGKG
jgi:thiol-disulfide isomerase/thioredoxin